MWRILIDIKSSSSRHQAMVSYKLSHLFHTRDGLVRYGLYRGWRSGKIPAPTLRAIIQTRVASAILRPSASISRDRCSGYPYLVCGYFSLTGRPDFNCGKAANSPFRLAILSPRNRATPIRSNSLFLISTPAFRQAFLTWPSTACSVSGMV